MYDYWFTLGVAAIKPELVDVICAATPAFDFVQRIVIEIQDGKLLPPRVGTSTGLLQNKPTTDVRDAISKFLHDFSPAAPPVGVYCAGRLSQLCCIEQFDSGTRKSTFKDISGLAHTAYVKAIGKGSGYTDPRFPAFLGLCMMDGILVSGFKKRQPAPLVKRILAEFGVEISARNRDWQIARRFVDQREFTQATSFLMAGDDNPWFEGSGCFDQAIFWPTVSEHAVP